MRNFEVLKNIINENCSNCKVEGVESERLKNTSDKEFMKLADKYFAVVREVQTKAWNVDLNKIQEAGFHISHIQHFMGRDEVIVSKLN